MLHLMTSEKRPFSGILDKQKAERYISFEQNVFPASHTVNVALSYVSSLYNRFKHCQILSFF